VSNKVIGMVFSSTVSLHVRFSCKQTIYKTTAQRQHKRHILTTARQK